MNEKTMLTAAAVAAVLFCIGAVYLSFTSGGFMSYLLGVIALVLLIYVAKTSRKMG